MSTAQNLRQSETLQLVAPDYAGAFAEQINYEHRLVVGSVADALRHAARAGELLLEVKDGLERGQWKPWVTQNFDDSVRTAQLYMRVAQYRHELPEHASLSQAQRMLAGRPRADSDGWADRGSARGKKSAAMARARAKKRAAMKALEREQRARAAKKRGGTIASGYASLRVALQDLERAAGDPRNDHCRSAIDLVIHRLYAAEDAMKDVLGLDHGYQRKEAA